MATSDNVIKLRVDSNEYENKIKRASQGITDLANSLRNSKKSFAEVDEKQLQFIQELGKMQTVSKDARRSVRELTDAYVQLSVEYNKLSQEEKDSASGKALAQSLEDIKKRANEASNELKNVEKELNNTGKESNDTGGKLKQLADRFTINIDALKLFDIGLKAVKGALSVAKDAFFASDANIDEWGRTVESAKSIYNGFLNAINTGDISGFLSRIDDIVLAARKAYDELDKLGTMQTIQAPQISGQKAENERLRAMLRTRKGIQALSGSGKMFDALFGIKEGQDLNPAIIRVIEARLQNGMNKVVELAKNEVNQTNKSIDAFYDKLAKENGMSLAEFRQGTSSWVEFSKRMDEYEKYQEWNKNAATEFARQGGRGSLSDKGNPFKGAEKWGVFMADDGGFKNLVQLIQQRDAQIQSVYGMQMQGYRAINGAENRLTPHGGGGGTNGTVGGLKAEVSESLTELQILEDQLNLVTKTMSAYARGSADWVSANAEATDLSRQIGFMKTGLLSSIYNRSGDVISKLALGQEGGVSAFGGVGFDFEKAMAKMGKSIADYAKDNLQGGGKEVNLSQTMSQVVGGVSQMVGGLEQLGVEIPDGLKDVLGGIQAVLSILTTISTILSAIEAISAADTLIPFARGGIVPHAARGYFVPGNNYSSDTTPVLANAGELILNRAAQNNIASQLTEASRSGGSSNGLARVSGEQIYIAMSNYLRRSGKGELVTWR